MATCTPKSSADGLQIAYVEQVDCGEIPTNPELQVFGVTGESIDRATTNTDSSEIYADKNARDTVQTAVENSGGVNLEWRINALKSFLKAGIQTDGDNIIDATGSIDIDATDQNDVIVVAPVASTAFVNTVIGQYFRISDMTNAGNNGIVKVVSLVDSETVGVTKVDGALMVTEVDADASLYSDVHINGTTQKQYAIERIFTDAEVPPHFWQLDMEVSAFNLAFGSQAILTGDIAFIGRGDMQSESAEVGATYLASSLDPILNTVDSVGDIVTDGTADSIATGMTLAFSNQSRGQTALGSEGFVGVTHGEKMVTGTFDAYYKDLAKYQSFKDQDYFELAYVLEDTAGNALAVRLPRTKFTAMPTNASGKNTDIITAATYKAVIDPVIGGTIELTWLNKVV